MNTNTYQMSIHGNVHYVHCDPMSEIPYDSDMTYDSDTSYDGDAVLPDSIFLGDVPVKLYLGDLPVSAEILVGVR